MQLTPESDGNATLCLVLKNAVKPEQATVESNRIGLKSSIRNMERMSGNLQLSQTGHHFEVTLFFPVTAG